MFNVAVLKMKDIIKYSICTIITLIFLFFIANKLISISKKGKNNTLKSSLEHTIEIISEQNLLFCLDLSIPTIANINKEYNKISKEDEENSNKKDYLKSILQTQISSIKGLEKTDIEQVDKNNEVQEATNNTNENTEEKEEQSIQIAQEGLKTEVITQNPITESFNTQYNNVKIKNGTKITLTQEMMTPDIEITNKNILLFHTHSCESYTSSPAYTYTPTGNFRTTDKNFSVIRVGTELENQLKLYNRPVIHDTSYHDYPAYNGSYTRSLQTVENILKTNQADIIIDLHRDAIGSRSDYAPIVKIGENDVAAQLMFVIGTNRGGLWHPNWNQNLKFAIKVQEKAEEMYPGLFKPIMLTDSRYNQHTGKYASIIEVGATGNTLEQCLTSMKYLAKVLDEVMK